MKLIIGTANFSKLYGLDKKKIKKKNLQIIFNYLKKKNIHFFDCSNDYKNLSSFSGYFFNKTKLFYKIKVNNIKTKLFLKEILSIKKNIYCLMIHNIDKYSVENLKKNYLILKNFSKTIPKLKIGISIYDIKDLNLIKKSNLRFDYIQIPINILNNTFTKKNTSELRSKGSKFIARSIFLQGLLLKNTNKIIKHKQFLNTFTQIENFSNKYRITNLELCLDYIKKQKWINKLIIGIDNEYQLKKILSIIRLNKKIKYNYKFFTNEKKIIDPRLWN